MFKKIIEKITIYCLNYLYNYTDKNNDGKISKLELKTQIYEPVIKLINKVNSKRNK
jgi:hypothetical protein